MKSFFAIKPPILLKTILDICFYILVFSFIGSIVILFWQVSIEKSFMTFKIKDHEVSKLTFQIIALIIAQLILAGVFIYVIDLFRKLVRSFFKPRLFTKFQVTRLNLIGILILLTSFGEGVLSFLTGAILQDKARVGFTIENNFCSFWFTIGLGLFFLLLSKAFDNARILQEENELTV